MDGITNTFALDNPQFLPQYPFERLAASGIVGHGLEITPILAISLVDDAAVPVNVIN